MKAENDNAGQPAATTDVELRMSGEHFSTFRGVPPGAMSAPLILAFAAVLSAADLGVSIDIVVSSQKAHEDLRKALTEIRYPTINLTLGVVSDAPDET